MVVVKDAYERLKRGNACCYLASLGRLSKNATQRHEASSVLLHSSRTFVVPPGSSSNGAPDQVITFRKSRETSEPVHADA